METTQRRIICINEACSAYNFQNQHFCHLCGFPVVKRYLWALNSTKLTFNSGQLISQRYLCQGHNVFLDTNPRAVPESSLVLPEHILPYLNLSFISIHIPQVFAQLLIDKDIWLLDYGTVPLDNQGKPKYEKLLPTLFELWPSASSLKQLNWLYQIAKLWQPLKKQAVVSTLLQADLLKINGDFIQVYELCSDQSKIYDLEKLTILWRKLIDSASLSIRDFLESLCHKLEDQEINTSQELVLILEDGVNQCSQHYDWSYSLYMATDVGSSREHNEDACFPKDNTLICNDQDLLAIVCDGIGGQDAGEVASNLAIENLKTINLSDKLSSQLKPDEIIRKAIFQANDLIVHRNNQENRTQRQRMGTTLVLALAKNYELFLAHMGDSRAYWITATSCQRITIDDDIANRSVRLGTSLYREANQYINSGTLTQALGISSSEHIDPTVQRQIPSEDCLILLTSDGLSDYDRIEQYWPTMLTPLLEGKQKIQEVGKNLIDLANEKNGHDNTTIALIHCQVRKKPEEESFLVFSLDDSIYYENPKQITQPLPRLAKKQKNIYLALLGILIALTSIVIIPYLLNRTNPQIQSSPSNEIKP
jgi:protein phosphatase